MAGISAFRSDDARAAYCQLYDAAVAASTCPSRSRRSRPRLAAPTC
jgi:hypothetical protein